MIQRRLVKLYERLAFATEDDWADYTKMRVGVVFRAQNPIWKVLTKAFASQRREFLEVAVTPTSLTLVPGGVTQYVAIAHDRDGNVIPDRSFEWKSSNPSVATVDHTGVMTAVAAGAAIITATETVTKLQAIATVVVC